MASPWKSSKIFSFHRTRLVLLLSINGWTTILYSASFPCATTPQGIANRYIHARWNAEKQRFAHFDGAVRIYTPESYTERLKSDLKKFEGKAAIYRKLFRLDAPLDIATWSR